MTEEIRSILDKQPFLPYTGLHMSMLVIRFALSLIAIASGIALFAIVGDRRRAERDPALVLFRIPLLPDLAYTACEAAFLACALARIPAPSFLRPLSECVQLCLGFAYVLFAYRSWRANGLSAKGHVPISWIGGVTAINLALFAARYPLPALEPAIHMANKIVLAVVLIYAGVSAVAKRWKLGDFYPSTKGGFWMAFFCLAYVPFVGLAEVFSLESGIFDRNRSVVLQAFPARELVVLAIFSTHVEPLYSRLWGERSAEPGLSGREREVAELLRRGMTNAEIACELSVSVATVKTHVRNVLRKTGVSSRAEIAASVPR